MHPAQVAIHEAMQALVKSLGVCEQTTHGIFGPRSLDDVLGAIRDAYEEPSPYSISTLSQSIRRWLEADRDKR